MNHKAALSRLTKSNHLEETRSVYVSNTRSLSPLVEMLSNQEDTKKGVELYARLYSCVNSPYLYRVFKKAKRHIPKLHAKILLKSHLPANPDTISKVQYHPSQHVIHNRHNAA